MKSYVTRGITALGVGALLGAGILPSAEAVAQETRIESSAVTLSSGDDGRAELWVQLEDGSEHRLSFARGFVTLDDDVVGEYETRGEIVSAWRDFLRGVAGADAEDVQAGLDEWSEQLEVLASDPDEEGGELGSRLARRLLELLRDVLEDEVEAVDATGTMATISGPDGSRLTIAPGGVEFDALIGELDGLRGALAQLGMAAADATDNLALIVHDDFTIAAGEVVPGNLALLGGTLEVGGDVMGNVLILDGELILADDARVEGDILQVGGNLRLGGEGATILGEVVSDFPSLGTVRAAPTAPRAAPDVQVVEQSSRGAERSVRSNPVRRFARNLGNAAEEFMGALTTFITLGAIGLLLVYFAQTRVEMVADTVRHEFARSFAMGLAAEVLFFPALIVLCVLVITWPIVPFFVLGTGLAMLAGYLAVAHGAGEMFARRRYRYEWLERIRRSNSYYYVLSGLVLLLLPFAATAVLWILGGSAGVVRGIVATLAAIGTWILMTAGFGGLLLTRAGSRSVVVDWSDSTPARPDAMVDDDVMPGDMPLDEDVDDSDA